MAHAYNRRDFIKFLAAGAATGTLAGCATTPEMQKPIGRVIVIGGGFGGATAAKYIRMWSGGRIEVIMIDRSSQFVSCPMSNLVIGGSKTMADITSPYDNLSRRHGVNQKTIAKWCKRRSTADLPMRPEDRSRPRCRSKMRRR